MKVAYFLLWCSFIALIGCDKGLTPPPQAQRTSLSGKIHFAGQKPDCDSVQTLAVVLSKDPAPFSINDILLKFNISIFVQVLEPCAFRDTSFTFDLKPDTYHYLGVVQKYDTAFTSWRVIGFAHDVLDSATSFTLDSGTNITNADIRVRFDSSSRQPFK